MFAQINHMAMVSPIYPMLAKFYEAYFGLKPSGKTSRPLNAVTVGDGYVGLNINPQRDGYVGGLDHFGMVVEDLDKVMERARSKLRRHPQRLLRAWPACGAHLRRTIIFLSFRLPPRGAAELWLTRALVLAQPTNAPSTGIL